MKLAGVCEKILSHLDKRNAQYDQFDEALAKLKVSKDTTHFQSLVKKINGDHKNETQIINDMITNVKGISGEVAAKVTEVQKWDRSLREQQQAHSQLVDKLVTGKVSKPQFIDLEKAINNKKSEAREKIQAICSYVRSF